MSPRLTLILSAAVVFVALLGLQSQALMPAYDVTKGSGYVDSVILRGATGQTFVVVSEVRRSRGYGEMVCLHISQLGSKTPGTSITFPGALFYQDLVDTYPADGGKIELISPGEIVATMTDEKFFFMFVGTRLLLHNSTRGGFFGAKFIGIHELDTGRLRFTRLPGRSAAFAGFAADETGLYAVLYPSENSIKTARRKGSLVAADLVRLAFDGSVSARRRIYTSYPLGENRLPYYLMYSIQMATVADNVVILDPGGRIGRRLYPPTLYELDKRTLSVRRSTSLQRKYPRVSAWTMFAGPRSLYVKSLNSNVAKVVEVDRQLHIIAEADVDDPVIGRADDFWTDGDTIMVIKFPERTVEDLFTPYAVRLSRWRPVARVKEG